MATNDPNDHLAIVQDQTPRSMEDIIDIMTGCGSTVTKAEALSVIEEYEAAIAQLLGDGDSINTPLFRISASIPGEFIDQNEVLNPPGIMCASTSTRVRVSGRLPESFR